VDSSPVKPGLTLLKRAYGWTRKMGRLVRVSSLSELQPGDKKAVKVDGETVLLVNVERKIYAVSDICTHEYAELVNGFLMEDIITCPLHLSRFKVDTGEALSPPATKPLKTYKVILQGADIYLDV